MAFSLFLLPFIFGSILVRNVQAEYQIGVGIADCTGPPAEVIFMGYAKLNQKGEGLHLRQFARAFIIEDEEANRLVFVSADIGMMGHGLRRDIIKQLQKSYGKLYNDQNVILSGTHTHGGPGGYLMDVVFDITCLGFVKETFNAIREGIVKAVQKAHENMVPGKIYLSSGIVKDANINRSPTAYLQNPEAERNKYQSDVDKEITQLKFVSTKENADLGVINWFAVHPTSMNNSNHLVTSDNVGYASILFEERVNGGLPGQGKFVAAFASSNLGDVSPNIEGAKCINTGKPCDKDSSTCDGKSQLCIASGPGKDIFESTSIIAKRILNEAWNLFSTTNRENQEVTGPIKSIHQYVNMPEQTVEIENEYGELKTVKGCLPAMGYSFAAGTTDGPGEFDFKQGTVTENKFWNFVRNFLAEPSEDDIECQKPKPILLATGRMNLPYEWQPKILSSQVAMIGKVVIAAIPGEFTTMSGRRMREALKTIAGQDSKVIIAGLCNTYTDYITTFEEYQVQRYEGASTIYGPHTLSIHIQQYKKLLKALIESKTLEEGPVPEDISNKQISFVIPVIIDLPESKYNFGDSTLEPPEVVTIGDTVTVEFISGHPRNNLMHEGTYLKVQQQTASGWTTVATDASWETRFYWKRTFLASSRVKIQWDITDRYTPGFYRIVHFGHKKSPLDGITSYQGTSKVFNVKASNAIRKTKPFFRF